MKKLITLAAASMLATGAFTAQAQITVDGQITTAEVSTTGYTLVGRDTGPRGFAPAIGTNDAGLLSLYAGADANNLYFFLVGTLQNDGNPATISNALQLLISRPGVTGVPVGTQLPTPASGGTTSFQGFGAYLDMPGDIGIGIKGNGTAAQYQTGGVVYAGGTATAGVLNSAGVATAGAPVTISGQTGALAVFNGAQVAYRTAANLNSNPGYGTAGTATNGVYGTSTVPAYGLEIAISRASISLAAAGGTLRIFALQNNAGGDYVSSDYIPQNTGALPASFTAAPNLAGNPDFRLIPGTQAAGVTVGAATGVTVLATKAADAAALGLNVYPNPAQGVATVAYNVGSQAANVNIVLTDLLGRPVQTLENSRQAAGLQTTTVNTANVAAGTYLMRVQVGDKVSTSKIVLL